jgi:thiamine-phosphate pyrophosphorylase
MMALPRLYAVADGAFGDPVRIAMELFDGGVSLVQIRHKTASSGVLIHEVEEVLRLAPRDARIIVNDRPDVARLAGAWGVHLGQEDLSPSLAQTVLSEGQVIGWSTHSLSQAMDADDTPIDYIAVGPIFATSTKENAAPVLGLERLREICSRLQKPVVAIGGITLDTARDVLNCGAASVAVIGDLLKHGNIADRARTWMRCLES